MQILDGKIASDKILSDIKSELALYNKERKPSLAVIMVGENPASHSYVLSIIRYCDKVGYDYHLLKLPLTITEEKIIQEIHRINESDYIDGLMVQLPLPKHINQQRIIDNINPNKDIDGFHPLNFGKMSLGIGGFKPATPYGICKLLDFYNIETKGKHVVVLGRSNIVGKPISIMLGNEFNIGKATVTSTQIHTPDELRYNMTRSADIIVIGIGAPNYLKAEHIKDGAVIVDVGINDVNGKLVGDVDFESIKEKAAWCSPTPRGTGLMTIAALLLNTFQSYKNNFCL